MQTLDLYLLKLINNQMHSDAMTSLMNFLSSWLPFVLPAILYFIVSYGRITKKELAIVLVTCGALTGFADFISTYYFKKTYIAIRPCVIYDWIIAPPRCAGYYSFPSNHAFNIATICIYLLLDLWVIRKIKKQWVVFVTVGLALLVGLSRVYFGVHRPTEVWTGLILGGFLAYAYFTIQHRIKIAKAIR